MFMYNYMYNYYALNFTLPANGIIFAKTTCTKKYWTGLFYMIEVYVHTYKLNQTIFSYGLKYFKINNTTMFTMSGEGVGGGGGGGQDHDPRTHRVPSSFREVLI